MLPIKLIDSPVAPTLHSYFKTIIAGILAISYFYGSFAEAAVGVDLGTMIDNFTTTVPQLMRLITAFAYVAGFYMVFQGILKLKQYGESRTMMSSQHELKGPMIYIMVGAALIYLPSSVRVGLTTFWSSPNPYAYRVDNTDQWGQVINDCYMVVQMIGTIAFIRGLLILSHLGAQQGQPGTFGKGMAHVVGGILCINIYEFTHAVMNTLALGQT